MAKVITTIKKIATLGKRELRYTDIEGEKKYDIRAWSGDKYEEGVRFSQEEIDQLYKGIKSGKVPFEIGNKLCVIDGDNYALSVLFNGRTYVRPFATKEEMGALLVILDAAKDNLLEYEVKPKTTEVEVDDDVDDDNTTEEEEKKSYANAYEKFKDQFEKYRKSQPENRQKGYELTHNIILEHIKDVIATSDEYNKNAMQEWKDSHKMMTFCQDKAFENAEAVMNVATREEANELMFQFVDEYIGLDDKPKPQPKKSHTVKKDKVEIPKGLKRKLVGKG